jgi:hypothetical protein
MNRLDDCAAFLPPQISDSMTIQRILPYWLCCFAAIPVVASERNQDEFFENQVRPLLIAKCQECHGREKQMASLRLDSKMGVLSGGENGASVIAGQVDQSLVIQAVRREGLEMPPDEALAPEEIAIFEKWVRDGAYWPNEKVTDETVALGDQVAITAKGQTHWSFKPLQKPTVPNASEDRNPIDAFVAEKLASNGLQPLPSADRRTLIRRAYFDVIGLPPTSKAIEEFEKDQRPNAYEELTNSLLTSKEFGQRWGRYWLDLARYADTRDWMAQTDERYPFAYTYRDYVIRSINQDKPYDLFIKEQIAADLLNKDPHAPELAALGFLTVGPRFRNDSLEQIADRVDCITRGIMGITVACARCHDHKYDPVTIEDYYALYGVFDSTQLTDELPTVNLGKKITPELTAEYEKARQAKIQERDDYVADLRAKSIDQTMKDLKKYFQAAHDVGVANSLDSRGAMTKYKVENAPLYGIEDSVKRLFRDQKYFPHPVWGPLARGLAMSEKDFAKQFASWLKSQTDSTPYHAVVLEKLNAQLPKNRMELLVSYAELLQKAIEEKSEPVKELVAALSEAGGLLDFDSEAIIRGFRLLGNGRKVMGDFESAIREVDASHPGSPPRAMVLAEKPRPVTPFVMLRGEPSRRGDRVPRRFISFFENGEPKPFDQASSGRLDLAEKIVDPANPLTARVAVNRVWQKYFGKGLVESSDDFGLRSQPPSHPELLDWLATGLIENGWSMKWLHRTILNSVTYQRSSVVPTSCKSDELDPDNLYLWRQDRRRLDFEATRDAMLTVSGELDRSLDGPSVKLSSSPFPVRRTVYAYVNRVDMDPMLKVFDFASPLVSSVKRSETIVPQHALFVMNHPFVIERAETIANKVRPPDSEKESINRGINAIFRRMLGRLPTLPERQSAIEFINTPVSMEGLKRSSPWSYGVFLSEGKGPAAFVELPFWTGQNYQGSQEFPDAKYGHARWTNVGGHPGKNGMPCVRRLAVAADGKASIAGQLKHARNTGDGVTASVALRKSDGSLVPLGQSWKVFESEASTNVDSFSVEAGDSIEMVVEAGKTPAADSFTWPVEITFNFDDQSSTTLSSKDGFKPPPPPMMDGWEQLAQALMLTNEFIYID